MKLLFWQSNTMFFLKQLMSLDSLSKFTCIQMGLAKCLLRPVLSWCECWPLRHGETLSTEELAVRPKKRERINQQSSRTEERQRKGEREGSVIARLPNPKPLSIAQLLTKLYALSAILPLVHVVERSLQELASSQNTQKMMMLLLLRSSVAHLLRNFRPFMKYPGSPLLILFDYRLQLVIWEVDLFNWFWWLWSFLDHHQYLGVQKTTVNETPRKDDISFWRLLWFSLM